VSLRAKTADDAFTAEVLGTERIGNGVIIDHSGLIVTAGYLITEAQDIWLTLGNDHTVAGHALGFDQATGIGLVQALSRIDTAALTLGNSDLARPGTKVVIGGAGGPARSIAAQVIARQEFAGYWEYVLDDAVFTAPAHPHWGGTAMIGPDGDLLGIGSLQLEGMHKGTARPVNMIIPINQAKPVIADYTGRGKTRGAARPWLGLYANQIEDKIIIIGVATGGPASRAGLRTGDVVLKVAGHVADDLAGFFRRIWSQGDAGVEIAFKIWRDGDTFDVTVNSGDRINFLKSPRLH
jgi:S1-C subfamily serine protease